MPRAAAILVLAMLALAGGPSLAAGNRVARLTVSFSWHAEDRCATQSPAFTIKGIPPGTATLRFKMTDLQVPSYHHGGGDVPYRGSGHIPRGAFTYHGPCPPSGSHDYRIEVRALDASGKTVLALGQATRSFPPR